MSDYPRKFVQRLQSFHRPLSKDGELWIANVLWGFYQCPGQEVISSLRKEGKMPYFLSFKKLWSTLSSQLLDSLYLSSYWDTKQRAVYLASWPGWIRQKRCWDNCLVLSKVLLLQKTNVRARRGLRQLEALPAPSQNNLPLQSTTTRQGLK